MGKRKNRAKKQSARIRCQDIPRHKPVLKIAEDIGGREPIQVIGPDETFTISTEPVRVNGPTRGETLKYYEHTIYMRTGVRA